MTSTETVTLADMARRIGEYETLLQIGSDLAGTLEPLRVLELALAKAEEICRAETSSVWELDDESQELFFRVVRGAAAGAIRDRRVPVGRGIVGSVALSGRAEVVNDVAADPRWGGDTSPEFTTRSILAAPLVSQAKVIGVLQLLNPVGKPGFSPGDLRRMQLFSGVLAQALANARLYSALKRQFIGVVTALADAIDKRDPYTGSHVQRVLAYALLLGAEMGLDRAALDDLRLAATLHDVGKIAVPDSILRKPAPLDPEEAKVIRRHPVDGAEIVSSMRGSSFVVAGVRSHHERLDGRGYPDGLAGESIPLSALIIAVADTFDAMTTSRPYRDGMPLERAAQEIATGAGTQFSPRVVEAFLRLFERGAFTLAAGRALVRSLFASIEEE